MDEWLIGCDQILCIMLLGVRCSLTLSTITLFIVASRVRLSAVNVVFSFLFPFFSFFSKYFLFFSLFYSFSLPPYAVLFSRCVPFFCVPTPLFTSVFCSAVLAWSRSSYEYNLILGLVVLCLSPKVIIIICRLLLCFRYVYLLFYPFPSIFLPFLFL